MRHGLWYIRAMDTPFRKPKDIPKDEPLEPVSGRIKKSAREFLASEAKKNGHTLSALVGRVLEDYAAWLKGKR